MTTIVTALFDINRQQYGDGRSFEKYLEWLPETLSLSSNYVIYTEDKVVPYIPKKDNIKVIVCCAHNKKIRESLIELIEEVSDSVKFREKNIKLINNGFLSNLPTPAPVTISVP